MAPEEIIKTGVRNERHARKSSINLLGNLGAKQGGCRAEPEK